MNPTILLAGRRPDPEGADARRFPIGNAVLVRERIRTLFTDRHADHLVCSAACGADLLALDIAGELGVRRHVVLPFDAATFRKTSVTDRPGAWGELFDRVLDEVQADGDLNVLEKEPGNDAAYAAVNESLLLRARELGLPMLAVSVWEGASRGDGDLTAHLLQAADAAGAELATISTL